MFYFFFRGLVYQNFVDFIFVIGKIIGYIFILKGDIDLNVVFDFSNKVLLVFL